MNPKLKMLCELYDRSDGNVELDVLLKVCFFEDLEDVLYYCSYYQCVKFAYLCAKSVYKLVDSGDNLKTSNECLKAVEEYLYGNCKHHRYIKGCAFVCGAVGIVYNLCASGSFINCSRLANKSYKCSILYAKDKQKQKAKVLEFLIQVIKERIE